MKELEKDFVPYDRALRLKALGFDEPCLAFYYDKTKFLSLGENPKYLVDQRKASYIFGNEKHGVTLAPTFSAAFRWFRENYPDLDFGIAKIHNGTNNYHYHINLTWEFFEGTYEEAELACLDKLIEIVESKSESNGNPIG